MEFNSLHVGLGLWLRQTLDIGSKSFLLWWFCVRPKKFLFDVVILIISQIFFIHTFLNIYIKYLPCVWLDIAEFVSSNEFIKKIIWV